ncbi:pirin family protein [Pedobacter gandavensis]|uniref:pirin family protein n=1 Tax=Pedobacter gandavensis TaxID=2679963 RepID=UPI0029312441|nr:pirin family protein [Pedobacter gandavensis]
MSNIKLIIEERASNIGNFMVGRLLPFREKRMVGPFAFIDHMGPVCLSDHENLDVAPHPHIGLSTLTYLFEGSIMHKDSLGNEVEIQPGQVNWMTAGKGIVHSERTPAYLRDSDKMLHGLQIWVALPKELELMEPEFFHVEATDIPAWEIDGVSFKLIAGTAFGKESPVPVYSPLYFLEIKTKERKTVKIGEDLFGESGLYILEGAIESEGYTYEPKQLLVANDSKLCEFVMQEDTTVYIFGGAAFPEERFIYWNFVATSKDIIEEAKNKWLEQSFEKVPGETDFVPLPVQGRSIKN